MDADSIITTSTHLTIPAVRLRSTTPAPMGVMMGAMVVMVVMGAVAAAEAVAVVVNRRGLFLLLSHE